MVKYVTSLVRTRFVSRWRHQMETFFAFPVASEFPVQRPVMRSFDVFFDLHPNKRLSKQSWGCWSETPSRPLWRDCNVLHSNIQVRQLLPIILPNGIELNVNEMGCTYWDKFHISRGSFTVLWFCLAIIVRVVSWFAKPQLKQTA